MGLLDNLERGLERAVRSAFSAGGPRAVKPVEIASALRQAMDDESFALSEGHTVAPNSYVVHFSPADFERARSWGSTLASELCDEVIRHADSQGYALPGTVRVAFHPDADVRAGDLRVVTRLDDGSLPAPAPHDDGASPATAHGPGASAAAPDRLVEDLPAAPPREPSPAPRVEPRPAPRRAAAPTAPAAPADVDAHADQPTVVMGRPVTVPAGPALELDGRMLPLDGDDLILGRSAERADLVIPDSSVSREHLRLLTVGSTVTLLDLGSRNGVLVNGRRVDGSVTLRDGDVVTVGQTELLFFGGTGGRA